MALMPRRQAPIVVARFREMVAKGMTLDEVKAARPTREFDARFAMENVGMNDVFSTDRWYGIMCEEVRAAAGSRSGAGPMIRPVKRTLLGIGLVVLLVIAVLGAGMAEMFVGLRPVEDGREINGIRIVADGFTTMAVIPSGPGEVILIDAGMDQTGAALQAELSRRQLDPSAVKAVFLTHGHGDHIGAIPLLQAAEVIALADEAPIAEGRAAPASPMGRLMPVSPTGIKVTRPVQDGDTVTIGEASVRVYAVPGHTVGSAAYIVNDVLFVGDSAQINSDGEIRPAPWLVTDDRAQNRASLVRLQQRLDEDGVRVAAIVPAHSGPAEGLTALSMFASAHAQ